MPPSKPALMVHYHKGFFPNSFLNSLTFYSVHAQRVLSVYAETHYFKGSSPFHRDESLPLGMGSKRGEKVGLIN